jgi:quinol-cytochrome oxidoreductase complex cytochrome b subunit
MKETADTIIKAITPLAEKIGEGAGHLYQVYIKQMYYEGILDLVTIFVIFVVTTIAIVIAIKIANKHGETEKSSGYDSDWDMKMFISATVATICMIVSFFALFGIQPSITKLVNPEYHAMQRIVEQVTPESDKGK